METSLRARARRAGSAWRWIRWANVHPVASLTSVRAGCPASWLCKRTGFTAFLADVGVPPHAQSMLERPDTSLPWGRDNARWRTDRSRSRHRNLRTATAFGMTFTVKRWAEAVGIRYDTLFWRLGRLSPEEALTRPVRTYRSGRKQCALALGEIVREIETERECQP